MRPGELGRLADIKLRCGRRLREKLAQVSRHGFARA